MQTGKGAQISSGVNGLCPRFLPRNPINSTILTQLANSLCFKFWSNWLRASLVYCESTQSQISRLCYLSSRSELKGSPRIDRAYLLRLLCTKPMVYSRPRDSSTRNSYDLTTSLFTPHDEDISDWQFETFENFLTKTVIIMTTACLYVQGDTVSLLAAHGIFCRRCLTGRRQTMGRRSSDSSQRYWCSLSEIASNTFGTYQPPSKCI